MKTHGVGSAIQRSRQLYIDKGVRHPFEDELAYYLQHGYVVSRPDLFAMGKPITLDDGRPAWFICMAFGNLREIAGSLPFYLPVVAFYRHWQRDRLRKYDMARLLKHSSASAFPSALLPQS